jgi:hypothetical protein
MTSKFPLLLLFPCFVACGDEAALSNEAEDESDDAGASMTEESPSSEPQDPSSARARALLGGADGDAVLNEVYRAPSNLFCPNQTAECRGQAVDLEFNPANEGELWVVFRQPYAGEPCTVGTDPGCLLMTSKVAIIQNADTAEPLVEVKEDGNSWHFMRVASGLAFADDNTFATVGEARTGNFTDEPLNYAGPTWWSADPAIFAQDFMLNGSHLDMVHGTPFGMGIAHQRDHVFWCFNGYNSSIDRYDFHEPHEPGGADHSDGEYHRYVEGEVRRQENVPSHMEFASDGTTLYIADSGNRRILALDTNSGGAMRPIVIADEQVATPLAVDGAELREVVPPGVVAMPSGLEIFDDHIFVTDAQGSLIHLFDLEGNELQRFETGLPEGTLAGLAVGPDEHLYLVDWPEARVLRLDAE